MTTTDTAGNSGAVDAASSSARTTTIEQDPAAASPGRTRSVEELKALVEEAQQRFGLRDADPDEVLAWAAETFGKKLAVACSMASDTVVPALVSNHVKDVDVLFLETGYHFPETLETRDRFASDWPVNVRTLLPELTVPEQDAKYGPKLHDRDPGLCCGMRKVAPLDKALAGYEAWVTGLRREETPHRANAAPVEWDEHHQMVKLNPVVDWSFDHVVEYAEQNLVVVNPLLGQGYPSIGCAPCTRKVAPGEDPRAGRWSGVGKTECGIHL
ncbi:phosphoadenylyl-sulfate reductase [Kocuria marina]|uniref:phosphoadenylyl-sulfate reductase n=1 Tax=Kocuria marina TaxID=223184 RepID=UPI0021B6E0E1|nr:MULTISPECIES: phosphoadenylyl-sulfate reductase [Kocuria]MCT2020056.1 phosphoadenylyl-sulfate reductase [Kocuria marina]